jgi:hypothetical protein
MFRKFAHICQVRRKYPSKVIVAWGQAISGHTTLRDGLIKSGYPELGLFCYALRNVASARDWLMKNGHPQLMALIRGAEGEKSAIAWLKRSGEHLLADMALAANNDVPAMNRLIAKDRMWAMIAAKMAVVKNDIEEDNQDCHRISS